MGNLVQFDPIKAQLAEFVAPIKNLQVVSDESMRSFLEIGKQAKSYSKRIDEIRVALVKPYNDHVKEINAYAKSLEAPLAEVESHIKSQLRAWEATLEEVRRAERMKAEEEARKAAEAAKADAEIASLFGGDEAVHAEIEAEAKVIEINAAHKAQIAAIDQNKVAGARKTWTFEITDASVVPAEFMIVDEKKVREAIRSGNREIPGIRIFQETSIALGGR